MNKHQLMALLPGLWERWHVCMDPQRLVPDTVEEWAEVTGEQLLVWSTKRQQFWAWDSYNPASWTLQLYSEETFVLDTPSGRVYGEWEVTEALEKGCLWVRFLITSEHSAHSFHNQRLLFDGWTLRRDEGDKIQMFQRSMRTVTGSVAEWKEAEVMASLRQLLSVSPSREAWKHLCCWLEIWETTEYYEQIEAYLQEHLRDWVDILPALKDGDSSFHKEELPALQKPLAKRDNCPSAQRWFSPQA